MGSADSIDGRRETKELRLIEFARRPSRVRSKAPEDWRSPRPGPAEIGASFWSAATESSESPLSIARTPFDTFFLPVSFDESHDSEKQIGGCDRGCVRQVGCDIADVLPGQTKRYGLLELILFKTAIPFYD